MTPYTRLGTLGRPGPAAAQLKHACARVHAHSSSVFGVACAACADKSRSGFVKKAADGSTKPYPCAELKSYCNHGTYGKMLRANCPKTCSACPTNGKNPHACTTRAPDSFAHMHAT